nr:aldo/keto reductase [uncultured Hyphomonas sp.]
MTDSAQLVLPDYGLGAAGLGNLYTAIPDETAREALDAASRAGFNYIDTAPFYGHGLSEQRVGAFLSASGERPVLSTKVGRRLVPADGRPIPDNGFASPAPFIPEFDYSEAGIRMSFEGSQGRLGIENVDILLLHDIGRMTHADAHDAILEQAFEEALPTMDAMKSEGLTRWIGLGVNEIEVCEEVLARVRLDVLLLAGRYTLLEHEASTPFLNACERMGVKIILGGAFNSGLLVASGEEPLHYDYAEAPDWAVDKVRKLRDVCAGYEVELPALALQFCHAHPAVAAVVPGARTAAQVEQVRDWTRANIDPRVWTELKDRALIAADAVVPS